MAKRSYRHSAYWYAYHNGWTYSEATTYAGQYLDQHTYRPRMREVREGESYGKAWFAGTTRTSNSTRRSARSFSPPAR